MGESQALGLPCAVRAGIAHYQFATIHPYYDGNGRTARLLTTLILRAGGYDLKGLYSLEEYYARNVGGYYEALTLGPSHNYYEGRAAADITPWVGYFCGGMAESFERVRQRAEVAAGGGERDQSAVLRALDPRQRKVPALFRRSDTITSRDVAKLFTVSERTARDLLHRWVGQGFLLVADPAKRAGVPDWRRSSSPWCDDRSARIRRRQELSDKRPLLGNCISFNSGFTHHRLPPRFALDTQRGLWLNRTDPNGPFIATRRDESTHDRFASCVGGGD